MKCRRHVERVFEKVVLDEPVIAQLDQD